MKRINNVYYRICNIDNIKEIYKRIRSKVNNKRSVYNYDLYEGVNLYNILDKLVRKQYVFDRYRIFLIREPKYRLIMSENISDKIVNHLISEHILLPALEHKLIDTNVATRKNKGSGYAFDMLNKYFDKLILKGKDIYILKLDIKKYFYNINHNILIEMLKKDIKDKDALDIIMKTLNTTNEEYVNREITKVKNREIDRVRSLKISDSEKQKKIDEIRKIPLYEKDKGLGIGNMTSQILAIYYMNSIDHFIKEELKFECYIRVYG